MFSSIVLGTDGSDTAIQALRHAVDVAGAVGARLDLVSAYPARRGASQDPQQAPSPREAVEASLTDAASFARDGGVDAKTHAREGDPAEAILAVAEEQGADLVIVGNRGMTGAKRFLLSSVPNKISHHAPCSVMIIRTT
jgi:nucleotide-binding universal stress UspA family protein